MKEVRKMRPNDIYLKMPPEPEWKFCFAGDWSLTMYSQRGPHVIARFLMRWLLDIHWDKAKKEKGGEGGCKERRLVSI